MSAPTAAELAAHRRRMAERTRKGQQFLDQVKAEKGRPLCLACDTVGSSAAVCAGHSDGAA